MNKITQNPQNSTLSRLTKTIQLAGIALSLPLLSGAAHAANYVVNNTNNTVDGSCSVSDCSLRDAFDAAEHTAGDSTITFDPSVFSTPTTITIPSSLTYVTHPLTVIGPDAPLTIQGPGGVAYCFNPDHAPLSVSKLTISNFGYGVILYDGSSANLQKVRFTGNALATVTGSSPMAINECWFDSNSAGAVNNASSNFSVKNSLFQNTNSIALSTPAGGTIENCTFFGNQTGINALSNSLIKNCTLTNNQTGIAVTGAATQISNSIIAGNATNLTGSPVQTNNLVGSVADAGFESSGGTATLAPHGGFTPTVALKFTSLAVNAAGDTGLATDQRGTPRPQGSADDLGAYELITEHNAPVVAVTAPNANQNILPANWGPGVVHGTATDDIRVNKVTVKLFHTVGGVKLFWNGTDFVPTSTGVLATLIPQGSATYSWSLDNVPTAAQMGTGAFTVSVVAQDDEGLNSTAVTRNFNIVSDGVAPVATVIHPAQSAVMTQIAFAASTVDGTATDNVGVTSISVKFFRTFLGAKQYWNGTQFGSTSVAAPLTVTGLNTTNATWKITNQPVPSALFSAPYVVQVQAKDAAGNLTTVTRTFTISTDAVKPIVFIDAPGANEHLLASEVDANTIYGHVTDDVSIAGVTIKLFRTVGGVKQFWNGSTWGTASVSMAPVLDGSDPKSKLWALTAVPGAADLAPGVYSVQAGATDSAGNAATFVTKNFIIDAEPAAPVVDDGPSGYSF